MLFTCIVLCQRLAITFSFDMKKNVCLIFLVAMWACIDTYNIELPSEPPRIVIDAVVSDITGESYINISWSSAVNSSCKGYFGDDVSCEPATFKGPYKVIGIASIIEDNGARTVQVPFKMDDKEGMILLKPALTGTPGSSYTLEVDIDYNGTKEFYSASSKMMATPLITDITYEIRNGDVGKEDNFVPLISFTDPSDENFYLFQLCRIIGNQMYCKSSRVWNYSIIADTFLPSSVKNLSVDDGASVAKYAEFFPPPELRNGAKVKMYSVDKVTYYFYKSLIDQFNNDGGAYSPTPAMPKGNISGNSIGLFRAVQESSASVYYQ
jgi:hypothetical protein